MKIKIKNFESFLNIIIMILVKKTIYPMKMKFITKINLKQVHLIKEEELKRNQKIILYLIQMKLQKMMKNLLRGIMIMI